MGAGWFFKIALSDPAQVDGLMNEADYKQLTG
jgi:glycine cleavage system H lipoate-binding protein